LNVDDSADTKGRSLLITEAAITGLAPAPINYIEDDLSGLDIRTDSKSNVLTVWSTPSSNYQGVVQTTLHTRGHDAVNVGNPTTGVRNVVEGLKIVSTAGSVELTVDDKGDSYGRTARLDATTLTGLAPAKIDWSAATLSTLIVADSNGGTTFTIANTPAQPTTFYSQPMFNAVDKVSVQKTQGSLEMYTLSGHATVTLGSPSGTLTGLAGAITVGESGFGTAALVVDDSGDTHDRNFTVADDAVTGLAPKPISLAGIVDLTINGGSGANQMSFGNAVPSFAVTFHGGVGKNTLYAPDQQGVTHVWSINGVNSGTLDGTTAGLIHQPLEKVTFSGVQNLVGSGGLNTFHLAPGGKITGTIDGGGNGWLDYSARGSAVTVNLPAGTATDVTGGVSHIYNVLGGQGKNTLTGAANGSILVGGAGTNVLTASGGRNLLIGGKGHSTLVGSTGDDILIAGSTLYDMNEAALRAILKEWQRKDKNFQQRQTDLQSGGGYNGSVRLNKTTIGDNDAAGAKVKGGGGSDWIIAGKDDIVT
jgi:hypothetical protein